MNLPLARKIWSQDWLPEHHTDTCPPSTETVKSKQGQRSKNTKPQWVTPGIFRGSRTELFIGKGVLKIYSEFTGEHPCPSVISIELLSR